MQDALKFLWQYPIIQGERSRGCKVLSDLARMAVEYVYGKKEVVSDFEI